MSDSLHQEIAQLRARNDYLEAEISNLREAPDLKLGAVSAKWNLSKVEARILVALSRGTIMSNTWLGEHCSLRGEVTYEWANVYIMKIRRKIVPLKIKTVWGVGYCLQDENLDAIREVIAGTLERVAA